MKYIDADLLRKEVRRLEKVAHRSALGCADSETRRFHEGKDFAYQYVGAIIASLQQEHPEVDLVAKLKHHLATTPKEQLDKEWKELEPWSNVGPTVREFLYGKQPAVDLEKFISDFIDKKDSENQGKWCEEDIIEAMKSSFALGLNARKV